MSPSPIHVAPFGGEFGWLVSVWIPWLRGQAKRTNRPLRVYCEHGHESLVDDFATPVPVDVGQVLAPSASDCHRAYRGSRQLDRSDYLNVLPVSARAGAITPPDLDFVWTSNGAPCAVDAEWHRYSGGADGQRYLVCVHARSLKQNAKRNWPTGKWDELLDHVDLDVVAIGTGDGAHCPAGCVDVRGASMECLLEVLSLSRVIVGPSSGPMPLANLCETPAVWWSEKPKDVERFRSTWNPFEVQNTQAAASWDPPVEDVARALMEAL